ncbi:MULTISPECIES: hypothetical protein [unclassified Arthrobacter]|uniref:hypothetical protein n=1 Tax=unclassified Arthrobacter TaxID=235627 RepID=UPI001E5825DA|nr:MULTISPECIES: hypothetical protein [unclassified Arthrobacter]MCC9146532.1 hypothetical protein [Arthrobacter sp. zg-Y919]MDK1277762.1 hypothetical protein [Arthrobacter sp. zg.Y919]WIB02283.1 hypothetical protein QNO10_09945 [Arthrobacter sp. zg-Y919]
MRPPLPFEPAAPAITAGRAAVEHAAVAAGQVAVVEHAAVAAGEVAAIGAARPEDGAGWGRMR